MVETKETQQRIECWKELKKYLNENIDFIKPHAQNYIKEVDKLIKSFEDGDLYKKYLKISNEFSNKCTEITKLTNKLERANYEIKDKEKMLGEYEAKPRLYGDNNITYNNSKTDETINLKLPKEFFDYDRRVFENKFWKEVDRFHRVCLSIDSLKIHQKVYDDIWNIVEHEKIRRGAKEKKAILWSKEKTLKEKLEGLGFKKEITNNYNKVYDLILTDEMIKRKEIETILKIDKEDKAEMDSSTLTYILRHLTEYKLIKRKEGGYYQRS